MLELFKSPQVARHLRSGPVGPHLDSFAAWLARVGFARWSARWQLRFLDDFGQWLVRNALTAADLDEGLIDKFLEQQPQQAWRRRGMGATLRRFIAHLRERGIVAALKPVSEPSALDLLQACYEKHLRVERGLRPATIQSYRPFIRRFLVERFGEGPLRLEEVVPPRIARFILRSARSIGSKRVKLMVSALRSFFRFLLQDGRIDVDLAASVPRVAEVRLSTVPKHLSAEEVEQMLAACNRSSAVGRRDYAILVLLARLGLRAGEVVSLELDDIDWRSAEISVSGKGLVHERLPLLPEVGEAIAEYLLRDRAQSSSRRVFLRLRAPQGAFAGAGTVSTLVRRALKRAGISSPTQGAHLLRHSLATKMLRAGASMAEIGQVLRHQAANTTEIYAKVDVGGLRAVAQPWPQRGGRP